MSQTRTMRAKKRIALIAHDGMKQEMLDWTKQHADELGQHELFATGTTGQLLREQTGLDVHRFQSGPLGGISRLGRALWKANWTCWCFSGIHWNNSRTIRM